MPEAWLSKFFDPVFFDEVTCLTVDPAKSTITSASHPLVPVVSLVDPDAGRVSAKGLILGPFHVPRLLNHPDHGPAALEEVDHIADGIVQALSRAYGRGADLRHLVWAGMGGSIEDKYAGLAAGLITEKQHGDATQRGVQLWGVDDVNRDTLSHVLAAIAAEERAGCPAGEPPLGFALRHTVVVAQALGMTSVEPVFNVEKALAPAYRSFSLDVAAHFYKITIPGSLLDQALAPPVANIAHQPYGQSTCAGRHDYVSHGMLLPLQLCGGDAAEYARSLQLTAVEVGKALEVADWIDASGNGPVDARREAVVLLLPAEWRGRWVRRPGPSGTEEWREVALWVKQHIEESLGKTPERLLKVVTGLSAPTDPSKQLVLIVRVGGLTTTPADGGAALAAGGAEVRVIDIAAEGPDALGRLFQTFTVIQYRLAERWGVCAVNQPPVECYKRIVKVLMDAQDSHAVPNSYFAPTGAHTAAGPAGISLSFHAAALNGGLPEEEVAAEAAHLGLDVTSAADLLGCLHRVALNRTEPRLCFGEVIYFGNLTRGAEARALRDLLDSAFARDVWARAARSFADVGKGPGVGHATHAMSKQGGVLTVSILPAAHVASAPHVPELDGYPDDYQVNNAYANVLALAGFDVADDDVVAGAGHAGMAVLLRIGANDAVTRSALADVFARVAEVLRM